MCLCASKLPNLLNMFTERMNIQLHFQPIRVSLTQPPMRPKTDVQQHSRGIGDRVAEDVDSFFVSKSSGDVEDGS